ncbi:alkaline phosphatase D family protein [Pseudonocardia nigra]|uniref:alkaline phosphatase D family protein n=1 Tax=Pseudonocardia nigra TaxID=1921578 RepID=UPI0027E28461|nr:alkaline phosphatase D family protein [Pseudonocardia nigra]
MLAGAAGAAALTVALPAGVASAASLGSVPRGPLPFPFTLGVASGDPFPDGMVLWTRLAPQPLAEDGMGGMPARPVEVEWELAADERFGRVERRGVATAAPESAHSVHVELAGLPTGREYFYRFRAEGHISPVGRTRTAPNPNAMGPALTMCFASCSNWTAGFFTAYGALAADEPELVLHLGDYQYEGTGGANAVRPVAGPETATLAGYRQRHAQYKTDPDLQAAHAVAPWLVVWDDHELDNNWADEVPQDPGKQPREQFLARRAAAFQAYYENMPLRRSSVPRGIDMQLFRRISWGRLATFHMMDTRQYRSDQACGDGGRVDCAPRLDPARSLTGAEQEAWLLDGFRRSQSRWDVLGQQVFFAQRDLDPAGPQRFSMDAWDGYVGSRDRITRGWVDAGVRNPVVLTGDVHVHWANELKLDYADPTGPTVGTELVCTSVTSGGDGTDSTPEQDAVVAANPHIRFRNGKRGYVRTRFTGGELRADFRVVDAVRTPGAPVSTKASFVVADREPGLNPA